MNVRTEQAALIESLQEIGQDFVADVRNTHQGENSEPRICKLTPDPEQLKTGKFIVSALDDVALTKEAQTLLDSPVFTWNGDPESPVVTNAGNTLINTTECFPPSLTLLAKDYIAKGYGRGDTIYDAYVAKVGALFFAGATPNDFHKSAANGDVGLYFRDPTQTEVAASDYIVRSKLFFNQLSKNNLPGLDIHDITHHASQVERYGEFYRWMADQATEDVLYDPLRDKQRKLLNLVLLTTLEHSLVTAEDGVQSFGCLNWQSPRKSSLAQGVHRGPAYEINNYAFSASEFNSWSAVRAIASIYRGQIEAEASTGERLNWMKDMGYGMSEAMLSIVRPHERYDYSTFPRGAVKDAEVMVPGSPKELFENCRELIKSEF
jgi:hypothetical protein